ncbi:hypothetical protein OPV22_025080 [Ensete ventricosum]|uniref:Uncharacterized protein n=1 Tax=Ensete ventricosum TaxID=4639 RepID=A0AAV8Q6Y1_ENSVE|nr:hypothetical protein OPV22_025080 [Ensete ventricosum]
MGGVISRCCNNSHESNEELRGRVVVLEEEIREMKRARERDAWAYEHRLADFASKEEEWQREMRKKKQQEEEEEEAMLRRKKLSREDRRVPCLEICEDDKEQRHFLVECMEEEQARREEAVAKWKQLYLTIKTELDDLIQRTREGERFGWGTEESMMERLHKDLRDREESMETLRSHIAVMAKEASKKDREIDILRQSLRILSYRRKGGVGRNNLARGFCPLAGGREISELRI